MATLRSLPDGRPDYAFDYRVAGNHFRRHLVGVIQALAQRALEAPWIFAPGFDRSHGIQ